MKGFDVVALGELLIDFTESGLSGQGNPLFEANPGGAPCNVLAMLAKLGRRTAFIGKVGNDAFGRQLKTVVEEAGIDTRNLLQDPKVHTTLAFVSKNADGDRDFSFYRDPGADMMLRADEVQETLIAEARIFHFGSLSMTHPGVREATREALRMAKKHGCVISFDPNLREPLWESLDMAREQIAFGLGCCDVLKISDNELQWFTGTEDFDEGIARLRAEYDIPLILLSKGRDGSSAYYGGIRVDAGDTFCACILNGVLERDLRNLTKNDLAGMLRFSNAAASLITTKKGALRVMPEREDVLALLRSRNASSL